MLEQVNAALSSVQIEPKDAAAAQLARHYAELIDNAAPSKKYAKALDWLATVESESPNADEHERTICAALAEHSVASDLGPKLLAALTSLGMTPAAAGGVVVPPPASKPKSPLDELRQRRAEKDRVS